MSSPVETELKVKESDSNLSNFKKLSFLPLLLLFFIFALQDVFLYFILFVLNLFSVLSPAFDLKNLSESNQLFLTLFLNIVLDILPLLILGILIHFNLYKFNKQKKQRQFGFKHIASIYLAVSGAAFGISVILLSLAQSTGLQEQSSYQSIALDSQNSNLLNIALLFILICVIAPIFEETVFRRQLIPTLEASGYGTFLSVILSSFIFGLAHSTNDIVNGNLLFTIDHLIITTSLGIGLGIIYATTRDLRWNILLHGFFNFYPSFITQIVLLNSGTTTNNLTAQSLDPTLAFISLLFLIQIIAGSILAIWLLINRNTKIYPFFKQFSSPSRNIISRRGFYFTIIDFIGLFIIFLNIWAIIRDSTLLEALARLTNSYTGYFLILLVNISVFILFCLILFRNRKNLQSIWSVTNPDIILPVQNIYQPFFIPNTYPPNPVFKTQLEGTATNNLYSAQKFCGYCGVYLEPSFNPKFCPNCGKPLLGFKS